MDRTKIADYEILGTLGEGGMGIVYRARDATLDREIAIKVIRPAALAENAAERFIREAKACSRINHPNIVTVYAAGEDGGTPYLAMELLHGENLRSIVERGPVPWKEAVEWTAGILDALARLHAEGIVHRDLKPENIIVTDGGTRETHGFRHRAHERGRDSDNGRRDPRHGPLHVPRAGAGKESRRAERPLLDRERSPRAHNRRGRVPGRTSARGDVFDNGTILRRRSRRPSRVSPTASRTR